MIINDALIEKLEFLSKLKLSEEEKTSLKSDIGNIVEMFSKIGEVNTEGVLPLRHMTDTVNEMRMDVPENKLTRDQALVNAPVQENQYFAVPKVID